MLCCKLGSLRHHPHEGSLGTRRHQARYVGHGGGDVGQLVQETQLNSGMRVLFVAKRMRMGHHPLAQNMLMIEKMSADKIGQIEHSKKHCAIFCRSRCHDIFSITI